MQMKAFVVQIFLASNARSWTKNARNDKCSPTATPIVSKKLDYKEIFHGLQSNRTLAKEFIRAEYKQTDPTDVGR